MSESEKTVNPQPRPEPPSVDAAPPEKPSGSTEPSSKAPSEPQSPASGAQALASVKRIASRAAALGAEHLNPNRHDGLFAVRFLERLIERIRTAMAATPADLLLDRFTHYGNLAVPVAMLLALLYGILGTFRHLTLAPLLTAILFVIVLAAFQYAADKFIKAGRALMATTPSRLSSPAFLNTVALLQIAAAAVFLVGGLLLALQRRDAGVFFGGLLLATAAYGAAFIALHPDRINVAVAGDVGAGEEALGILSFAVKTMVRLIPIVYGAGMVVGAFLMLGACFTRLGPSGISVLGRQAGGIILASAAFPFAGYLFFLLQQLMLDVLRAILVLPGKIGAR